MPIYLTIPLKTDGAPLDSAVETHIAAPDRFRLQADRGWLIKFKGTTIELSDLLAITGHTEGQHSAVGPTLVTPLSTYYGVGPSDMWEWLKTRIEQ